MLGHFLELSISSPDVVESIAFYEGLGFTQAPTGETWSHPYAVVTDGRIALGLHQYRFPSPSLTWVQPDLERRLGPIDALGIEWAFRRTGPDCFNEAGFTDPSGQMVTMLEARTFSPTDRPATALSKLGWFEEIALPSADFEAGRQFWEPLGFVGWDVTDDPYVRMPLTSNTLNLSLVRPREFDAPAVVFTDPEMADRIALLAEAGYEIEAPPRGLSPKQHGRLVAPEGTVLWLTTRAD